MYGELHAIHGHGLVPQATLGAATLYQSSLPVRYGRVAVESNSDCVKSASREAAACHCLS